jgi:cobalamin biosynthesis protein CbiD
MFIPDKPVLAERKDGMELSKELKEKVQNAKSAEEAKKILKESGVELTDAEMDQVAGGMYERSPEWAHV